MADRVYIFDTTLRDGEQSPGCSMTVPEKLRMAARLVEVGADILEAGFPIASDGDFEAVEAVAREFPWVQVAALRSEEHTSELQSLRHLVCRLLFEKTMAGNVSTRWLLLLHEQAGVFRCVFLT